MHMFGSALKAEGNEFYVSIGAVKPRESKPRSKRVWVHKDKGTEEKICLGPLEEESRPMKVNPGHVVEDFFFTQNGLFAPSFVTLGGGGVVAHL